MKIKWTIAPEDIEWVMPYTDRPHAVMFEADDALALMLINQVVFLNSHWWMDDWPDEAKKITSINVNCNDIFAWGCADDEEINHCDIEPLYRMWKADPVWGAAKWCAIRRNQKPQPPVIEAMKKDGAWDDIMERLEKNALDAVIQEYFFKAICDSKSLSADGGFEPEGVATVAPKKRKVRQGKVTVKKVKLIS